MNLVKYHGFFYQMVFWNVVTWLNLYLSSLVALHFNFCFQSFFIILNFKNTISITDLQFFKTLKNCAWAKVWGPKYFSSPVTAEDLFCKVKCVMTKNCLVREHCCLQLIQEWQLLLSLILIVICYFKNEFPGFLF